MPIATSESSTSVATYSQWGEDRLVWDSFEPVGEVYFSKPVTFKLRDASSGISDGSHTVSSATINQAISELRESGFSG